MSSIRARLLTRLALAGLALSLVGAVCLWVGTRWLLTEQFDAVLETKLRSLGTLLEQEGPFVSFDSPERYMPEFTGGEEPEYFQIWFPPRAFPADGHKAAARVKARSTSLGEGDLPRTYGTERDPLYFDLELPDGSAGRAVGAELPVREYEAAYDDPGPFEMVVVVARSRAPLDGSLLLLGWGTLGGILVLLAGGAFLGWGVVASGLRPLEELTRHAEAIDDPLRAGPFPVAGAPAELLPVGEGLNALLARIRGAFERERRTAANIAHELRTPVSELVILTDVAKRCADDPGEIARALGELSELGHQMSGLIAMLLELANVESGQLELEEERLDLAEQVRACWRHLEAPSRAKGQRFVSPQPPGATAWVDRAALSIVLANVLDNAVEHSPEGAEIRCEVEERGDTSSIVLSNPANGMARADVDKLTEPFWRASRSRSDRSHAGLGLALAHRLAGVLGVELSFSLDGDAFRTRLELPREPRSSNGSNGHHGTRGPDTA